VRPRPRSGIGYTRRPCDQFHRVSESALILKDDDTAAVVPLRRWRQLHQQVVWRSHHQPQLYARPQTDWRPLEAGLPEESQWGAPRHTFGPLTENV
jgi:hypothetical protein